MEDTMDVMDDDDLEEAADGEIEKVLYELTAGELQCLGFPVYLSVGRVFGTCQQMQQVLML